PPATPWQAVCHQVHCGGASGDTPSQAGRWRARRGWRYPLSSLSPLSTTTASYRRGGRTTMSAQERRIDVVLEGGGVKGIALVGALAVLEEAGFSVNRVAGTSAGAIVGELAAARMPTSKMVEVMQELDYRRFQDAKGLSRFGAPGQLLSLLLDQGIYAGDYARGW